MNCVKLFSILAAAPPLGVAPQVMYGWLLPVLIPVAGVVMLLYHINSRPLRRQERARFLLDLIESASQQDQSVEHHIISLARSKDAAPGVPFHLLAAYLEKGYRLIPTLEKVPDLLPPQVLAMLKVGQSLGDFRRVMPACRLLLHDGTSQTRALINYQVAFGLIVNPLMMVLLPFIALKVLPVFRQVGGQMKMPHGGFPDTFAAWFPFLMLAQIVLVLGCFFFAVFLLGGTRFTSWLEAGVLPLNEWADRFFLRVPWRRKRLQRDFSAMLGLLLDSGVAEEGALLLAAASTANRAFVRRAEKAAARLRDGVKFAEAVQSLDDTGEFAWRLANGARGARGFFAALQGWQASLDAKAFELEQAAAQSISTGLVLVNAVTVVVVAMGVYQFLGNIGATAFLPHK